MNIVMNAVSDMDALLAVFLLTCLIMSVSSRLSHCVRIAALQGVLLGLLPLLTEWPKIGVGTWITAFVNLGVKAVALPCLLTLAIRRAQVRRELEPLVGYSVSLLVVLGILGLSFWVGSKLPLESERMRTVMPTAFSVMLTGLFMVMARRKAITQVIGFLCFENGISLFGAGMRLECGLVVEMGILLDVFVLVFIMGIAVLRINREFEHIDADRLNRLGDVTESAAANGGRA